MESILPGALEFKGYLTTNITPTQNRISSHHIIPQDKLQGILNYKCKDKNTPFCDALLAGGVKELCGVRFNSFLWADGNLFLGPNPSCRTDDPKDNLETEVISLMDCFFVNKPGTVLGRASDSLKNHLTLLQSETVPCDANSAKPTDGCIDAAVQLNTFYQGYCSVWKNTLYDLDFYLANFWIEDKLSKKHTCKHMFRLKKKDEYDCASIQAAKKGELDMVTYVKGLKLNKASDAVFLEDEAVVSNHFHKTKATDSSSFILDDSVDARF